jgi:hypothetical protein
MDRHVVVWAVSRWVFRDVIPSLARRERRLLTNDILHFELISLIDLVRFDVPSPRRKHTLYLRKNKGLIY